jgi:hypothetical protein
MREHPFKPIIDVIRQSNTPPQYECYYCGKYAAGKQLNDVWLIDGGEGQWIHVCKACDGDE